MLIPSTGKRDDFHAIRPRIGYRSSPVITNSKVGSSITIYVSRSFIFLISSLIYSEMLKYAMCLPHNQTVSRAAVSDFGIAS